jgi:hypothetical protein
MRVPVIEGVIRRRMLVNFRGDPEVVQRVLPKPFRPKLAGEFAIAGICLIRLEQIRPRHVPAVLGISSENAAHRIAVEWTDDDGRAREGVYIPRRDTDSMLNHLAGGRLFPGEHHHAHFVVSDEDGAIALDMESDDKSARVRVRAREVDALTSVAFGSLATASAYFQGGSLGYSRREKGDVLDGITLHTDAWRVSPLAIDEVHSSFFQDEVAFPKGTIMFDCALLMRDIPHEWHSEPDLCCG